MKNRMKHIFASKHQFALLFLILFSFVAKAIYAQQFPASRDPFLWPFAQNSIWNMPIGSNAQYEPAGLRPVSEFQNVAPYSQGGVAVDEEPIILAQSTDPLANVYAITDWSHRCTTTNYTGKQIHFPAGLNFADPNGSNNTPNYSGVVAQTDGSLFHFNAIATCGESKIAAYDYTSTENDSWFSAGSTGGHGGSGLSGFGGSIRLSELTSTSPIRHAIKLNVLASRYLVYNQDGTPGYRWPATKADGYSNPAWDATFGYGTSNKDKFPYMEIGVLLAIKPDVTTESLGITNPIALKLFHVLQDYGAYVTDDTHWNHYDIPMESGVAEEVKAATGVEIRNWGNTTDTYYQDMMKIFTNLYAVTNNSFTSIGGGGVPRQPLAPPFSGTGSFKIMPLGDSKTEGGGGNGQQSWRGYLRNKLVHDGYTIDYVGDRSNYANGDAIPNDNDHAGHGGYTIGPDIQTFCPGCETTGVIEHFDSYFNTSDPDIVLLAIGINDFFNDGVHPSNYRYTAPQRYRNLVDKILQINPNVKIILGTIEPCKWDKTWGEDPNEALGALNIKIKAIADSSLSDNIYYADIRNKMLVNWSVSDYYDDVHLSATGAQKDAEAWYDAIVPVLSSMVANPVTVTGVSLNFDSLTLEAQTKQQLQATLSPINASNKLIFWSSSNNSVAIVSSTGIVTALTPGIDTITVTTQDGNRTASILIRVIKAPENYTQNLGFELDMAPTQSPQLWSESGNNPETSFTESYNGAHNGTYHLTHYKGNIAYDVYTYQVISGLANGSYELRAWVISTGGQSVAQMVAKNFGTTSLSVNIPLATNWTQIQIPNIIVTNGQCEIGFNSSDVASWNYIYMDDIQFVKSSPTGINENVTAHSDSFILSLYPNPVTGGVLNITTKGNSNPKTLIIYDVLGRIVFDEMLYTGDSYKIDIGDTFPKGIYLVSVVSSSIKASARFVVK